MENRITVKEAAEQMGISQTALREGLARDKFPFGTGFKTKEENKSRVFFINKNAFNKYMKGNLGH